MREKFEQRIEPREAGAEFPEKETKEYHVEEIWLDSELDKEPCLVLDTPYSRLQQHNVFRTQQGELYLEKQDRSAIKQEEMLNEFVGSNMLQMLVEKCGIQNVLIPKIKASKDRPGIYYSSFIENTHSFLERNAFSVLIESAIWDKKILRKEMLPLVLAHLVNDDLDRNTSNYRLVVNENEPDKIAVLDFGEVVKRKGETDEPSYVFNIIHQETKKQDFEKPKEIIKKFFSEKYINEVLAKSFVSPSVAKRKKEDILTNLKNLDSIIDFCLEEVNKEKKEKKHIKKEARAMADRNTAYLKQADDLVSGFKKKHPQKWGVLDGIIEQYKAVRQEIAAMDELVEQAESYSDWALRCKQGEAVFNKQEGISTDFLGKVSEFNFDNTAQRKIKMYFEAVGFFARREFLAKNS